MSDPESSASRPGQPELNRPTTETQLDDTRAHLRREFTEPLDLGSTLGRFRLEELIGQGGMGRVYDAWDPRLRRRVAIKTLRIRDPESVHRFVREARLQASVSHPGICPVFEVGDDEATPYIVMQRLYGRPLDEAAEGLNLEQKLILVRRIAEAVHEAHRAGLIHRDIKPANILVESTGPDPLHPMVLDFGIARAAGDADLTRAGEVVGTPAYMAPEQVRGEIEHLDRRTDVYALGATLYRLLAGRPPFAETGPGAFVQVLQNEPESLRRHQVPKDVEAIVFKCLEKQPDRRYGSARELAHDIDCYLDGQEVSARPINAWYRLQKKLSRQKVAVRVAAVSALLLVFALGWGAWTAQQAEIREQLARRLTEQVEEIEALVRYSHLSPPHDIRPDRLLLRRRMDDIAQAMDRAGNAGHGPGHFALGRGHLALDELETAQEHLQTAWQSGFREPEVAAAMAQTLSALYRDRLAEVELGGDWQARSHQIAELQETFGHPARTFLATIDDPEDPGQSRVEDSPESLLLRALALFHDDLFDQALTVLADSPARHAWSYELLRLEGDIQRTWAVQHHALGRTQEALSTFEQARRAYDRAATVAQSDPSIYRSGAQAAFQQLSLELEAGSKSDILWQEGMEQLDQALATQPDYGEAWLWKSRFHRLAAQLKRRQAVDPVADLEAAIVTAERAKEDSDVRSKAWLELGRAYWSWSQWLVERGEDPSAQIDRADHAFSQIEPSRRSYSYWVALGMTHATRAQHLVSRGEPALQSFEQAAEAFRGAAEQHSAPFAAWVNLGIGLFKASTAPGSGEPKLLLEKAIHALEQAESLRADHVAPPYYLGLCHLHLAQGGDPSSGQLDPGFVEQAVGYFQTAQSIAPEMFQLQAALGEISHSRGIHSWEQGQDPSPFFAQARVHHLRAAELAPDSPIPILNLAWTAYFEGKVLLKEGRNPLPRLDEAAELIGQISESLRSTGLRNCSGSTLRLRGEWELHQERDPETFFAESENIFIALSEDNPRSGEAFRSLGRIWTRRAQRSISLGEDPDRAFARARHFLDQSLNLSPDNPYYLLASAYGYKSRSNWLAYQGSVMKAEADWNRARDQAGRARQLRPAWREAADLAVDLESTHPGASPG